MTLVVSLSSVVGEETHSVVVGNVLRVLLGEFCFVSITAHGQKISSSPLTASHNVGMVSMYS
jgi:hypothetical protein